MRAFGVIRFVRHSLCRCENTKLHYTQST